MGVLAGILQAKREEVEELKRLPLPDPPPTRPLSLRRAPGAPVRLIAEIKRRSPSAGTLSTALGVAERAAAYERAGASAVSVLCDRHHFDGAFEHLLEARAACALPLLCKDFVIDEVQLDAARAFGADAVLIIVRCLPMERVAELVAGARERGLAPFVEIHAPAEADVALEAGADIIGVNARDLDTLQMDASQAAAVLSALPRTVVRVHLSGLTSTPAVAALAASDVDAALVGEALMRQDDPEPFLRAMVEAARLA